MEIELKENLFEGREMTPLEIMQNLEATADKVFEGDKYSRKLTKEEKDELKTLISDASVAMKKKKKILKEQSEPINKEIKKLDGERELYLSELIAGSKEEVGNKYVYRDFRTMTIHTYDRRGQRINIAPMTAEDRQLVIKMRQENSEKATGTDN